MAMVTTAAVPLNFDGNLIKIKISAAGEESVTTFTIIRLKGSNPNLKAQPNGLRVSERMISYDETDRIYRINVENNVERLRMILMPQDTNVVEIALDGTSLDLGSLKQTGELSTVITGFIVGNNIKTLMITAHNGETTQSYTLIVNRAKSANDRLSGFGFSLFAGESSERIVSRQDFDPETLMYTLPDVEEEINRIKATLVSSDDNAKVEIRKSDGSYSPVERGMQSDFINLSLGENVIEIKVTAPDEITSRVYTVKMTRSLSINTDLSEAPRVESNLADRGAGSANYVIAIDADTTNFTVAATAAHSSATVMISSGDNADVRGSPSATKQNIRINREIEPVTITIVVISQSGTTSQTYSLIVNLAQSSETRLASLTAGATTLAIVENQTAYTASIGEEIRETTVTAVAKDDRALVIIRVDGVSIQATGSVSRRIVINKTGVSKFIAIRVRAEDDIHEEDYTLTVNRDQSSNACLSSLELISKDPMSNNIKDNLPCNRISIEFTLQNTIAEVVLRPRAADENATIKIFVPGDTAGEVIASGEESSRPIPIPEGDSVEVEIEMTAQDSSTRNYQVLINRGGSSDANLKDLQLLGENREQLLTFIDNQEHYDVDVPNRIRVATVMATAHDKATIELNGEDASSTGVISGAFEFEPGIAKQIRIVITSQDESTTKAYTVRVTRAGQDDSNAELGSIGLSIQGVKRVIILPPAMKVRDDATRYTATIRDIAGREVQEIFRVIVSPRAADSRATISVNGGPAISDASLEFTLAAALDVANIPITIKVIAKDGTTSQTYSLAITRESSADTRLESLGVGSEALTIDDEQERYEATIDEHTTNTTVTVTARHSQALVTISGGGGSDVNGNARSASKKISLATGESKELKIVVTAHDRTTTRGYTVRVTRDQSSDTDLADPGITVEGGTVTKDSDTRYTATIGEETMNTTVTVTARHPQATVTIREAGSLAVSDIQAISIANPGDSKVIRIVVTAQNGMMEEYTLTVTRARSSDAHLNKLELLFQPSGVAEVIFDSISSTQSYAFIFDNAETSVKVKPTANSDYAYKMEVFAPSNAAGEQIVAGGESSEIPLTGGGSIEIKIVVTAQDEVTTRGYIVRMTRALSSDANLSTLSVVPGTLVPPFNPERPERTLYEVEAVIESFVLTVGAKVNQAVSIALNDAAPEELIASNAEARSESRRIDLEYGANTLTIEVTAADETSKTYIVTAFRPVFLNSLSLTGLKSDDPFVFDQNTERYTVTVANESPALGVEAAVAVGTNLSYTISDGNDEIMQDSSGITLIPFDAGETKTITIVVTTQDGETTKSYTLRGTREISLDASLGTLQLLPEALGFSFDPARVLHTLNIPNPVVGDKITSIELKASGTHRGAMITMFTVNTVASGGVSADKNRIDADIFVDEGETKRIIIEVTAQDGETTKSYTVLLTRPASRDIRLRALTIEPDRVPQGFIFNPTTDTHAIRSYSIELPSNMANTTVTATANNENARLTIRELTGEAGPPSRSASFAVMIAEGDSKDIIIEVTAQSGTTETYSMLISRASANTNLKAQPNGFIVSEGTVIYDEMNLIYRVNVENNVESLQITLMPQDTDIVRDCLGWHIAGFGQFEGNRCGEHSN